MNEAKLKPCPFCGSPAHWATSTEDESSEIQCSNADCSLLFLSSEEDKKIETAWNTRPLEAELYEIVNSLRYCSSGWKSDSLFARKISAALAKVDAQ